MLFYTLILPLLNNRTESICLIKVRNKKEFRMIINTKRNSTNNIDLKTISCLYSRRSMHQPQLCHMPCRLLPESQEF